VDRVVLFIIDGMGLEAGLTRSLNAKGQDDGGNFFRRSVLEGTARLGVAKVRLPTESRPGHAAVLGGVYEDPAIFGARCFGMLAEPHLGGPHSTRYETLFDTAPRSWSFWPENEEVYKDGAGLADPAKHTASVDREHGLDLPNTWTNYRDFDRNGFDMVQRALSDPTWVQELGSRTGSLVHIEFVSPDIEDGGEEAVAEDVIDASRLVEKLAKGFQERLGDTSTFLVTADHGTVNGRHGGDDERLTHVPLVAWGRGIAHRNYHSVHQTTSRWSRDALDRLGVGGSLLAGVVRLRQVDVASLVAALLGISIPMNSRGEEGRTRRDGLEMD